MLAQDLVDVQKFWVLRLGGILAGRRKRPARKAAQSFDSNAGIPEALSSTGSTASVLASVILVSNAFKGGGAVEHGGAVRLVAQLSGCILDGMAKHYAIESVF